MKKKRQIVSCVLAVSLFFSMGCYGTSIVTKDKLKAKPKKVDITVHTKDSLMYSFAKENYQLQEETITGNQIGLDGVDHRVAIALVDITMVEATEKDKGRTTLLYIGIGLALVVPFVVLVARSFFGIGVH